MRHARLTRLITAAALAVAAGLVAAAPASAADARVTVANSAGQARIDPTYATRLTVSGTGFQAVKGGHGGLYVFFGTVKPGWQPSKGGVTGRDYFYVPDSETKDNRGYQRYIAFPGSDTASSANGGVMSASGSWSTQIVVPGATFRTQDREGNVRQVDCQKVTCGVITIGGHGIKSARNETFTPVSIGSLAQSSGSGASGTTDSAAEQGTTGAGETSAPTGDATAGAAEGAPATAPGAAGRTPKRAAPAKLEVDRGAAVAGNVLAFKATGLPAGAQVSAVFDDGAAGAGPFVAGADGSLAGVIALPADTRAGTHELRLYGVDDPPTVSFAVQAAEASVEVAPQAAEDDERAAWLFAGAAGLVLLLALVRLALRMRGVRRRAAV